MRLRAKQAAFFAFVAALLGQGLAHAGGPAWMHQQPTPEDERAQAVADRWRETGVAAALEMIEALCRKDPALESYARDGLVSLRQEALPHLVRAAADPRCEVAGAIATIVCETGLGGPELVAMFRAAQPPVVSTAVATLSALAKVRTKPACARGGPALAGAAPSLGPLLRVLSGDRLRETLWVAENLGPMAAPLVPDLIPLLEGEEVASNIAASTLGAVGPPAAPAVPTLRALLRRGGKWRFRATAALGGIGEPARPALPDFAPLLEAALPHLCETKPRVSEGDAIAGAIEYAAARIGGPGVEPLVPGLVTAFLGMRGCGVLGPDEEWLKAFRSFGRYGKRAAPLLMSIVGDAEASVVTRQRALDALDEVEPLLTRSPVGSARIRVIRAALARKREIFDRPVPSGPERQQWHPPAPPRTPGTLALCREEAGLPALAEPPGPVSLPEGTSWWVHDLFGRCVEARLCGPDEASYRATIAKCCGNYGGSPPWFCPAH